MIDLRFLHPLQSQHLGNLAARNRAQTALDGIGDLLVVHSQNLNNVLGLFGVLLQDAGVNV